jgi:hypothetical protein
MAELLGRVKPQILVSILCATILAIVISYFAFRLGAIEIITGVVGAAFGFYAGVSQKILEGE